MFIRNKGFTLIELLIVIAIIGILSAILLAVINPAQQRQKAQEAVARSALDKACLAVRACITSSSQNTPSCPAGWQSEYQNIPSGFTLSGCPGSEAAACGTAITNSAAITQANYLRITGTPMGTCAFSCNLSTGVVSQVTVAGTTCATN